MNQSKVKLVINKKLKREKLMPLWILSIKILFQIIQFYRGYINVIIELRNY